MDNTDLAHDESTTPSVVTHRSDDEHRDAELERLGRPGAVANPRRTRR